MSVDAVTNVLVIRPPKWALESRKPDYYEVHLFGDASEKLLGVDSLEVPGLRGSADLERAVATLLHRHGLQLEGRLVGVRGFYHRAAVAAEDETEVMISAL